jgi:hypothetical protein
MLGSAERDNRMQKPHCPAHWRSFFVPSSTCYMYSTLRYMLTRRAGWWFDDRP